MPTDSLNPKILRHLRDRQGLLWVCQPYDLVPGALSHDYKQSPDSVRPCIGLMYRRLIEDSPGCTGRRSGSKEQIARSCAVRGVAEKTESAGRRPVVLSGADDTEAAFSEYQFLPVCVLPGLLDPRVTPGARYGGVKARVRQQIAITFAKRIERYPHRVLVVLGARDADDLQSHLYPGWKTTGSLTWTWWWSRPWAQSHSRYRRTRQSGFMFGTGRPNRYWQR